MLQQVRAAQNAYFEAAAAHREATEVVRGGFKTDADGSQLLHIRAASELAALEKYSQAVRVLADAVLQEAQPGASAESTPALTCREREVLKLIGEGLSSKEVATELGISFRTAVCHRYRIMQKLNIHDVARLVKYAIRRGIVQA